MTTNNATQILTNLWAAFPELNEGKDLSGSEARERLAGMWDQIRAFVCNGHEDNTVLVAFQMGYCMARRDKDVFNTFQDKNGVILLSHNYLHGLKGRPPLILNDPPK